MKNIHVLSTDKPSRLYFDVVRKELLLQRKLSIGATCFPIEKRNIYITSDEEIKEGDWVLFISTNEVIKVPLGGFKGKVCKKIILTDNKDLIKDGVQAIDDEFLEWFVKNPSCEQVLIESEFKANPKYKEGTQFTEKVGYWKYYFIFPKEEPKQETLEEAALEYASEKLRRVIIPYKEFNANVAEYVGFVNGANWQAERMYSEEDLKQFAFECVGNFLSNRENQVERELVDVILDRNNKLFEKFKFK